MVTAREGVFSFSCHNLQQGQLWPELQHLLDEFADLFKEPKSIPPQRLYDHKISLNEGVELINIRPYKYAAKQNDSIETMIKEMLKAGVIRYSSSPYAIPIVFVKKKYNSWRMYVDYRTLNALTMKDKYPIPVIDKLLDEPGRILASADGSL